MPAKKMRISRFPFDDEEGTTSSTTCANPLHQFKGGFRILWPLQLCKLDCRKAIMSSRRGSRSRQIRMSPSSAEQAEPNLDRATRLVLELMALRGESGQEKLVSDYIFEQLKQGGADPKTIKTDRAHRRTRLAGQVGNLAFQLRGKMRGERRMLLAHMDTVPICLGAKPILRGSRIRSEDAHTGLGADDRAGVAVVLNTALELLKRGLSHPPLTFFWSVQEEVGLQGVRHASLGLLGRPKLAFNFDGGSPEKLTVGATGGYRMRIRIRGLASHAGNAPELGISAITIAGLAIADLQRRGWHGGIVKGRYRGTSNIGVIEGGSATNVVAEQVTLRAEARSYNATFRRRIVREIERAFSDAVRSTPNAAGARGTVEFDGQLDYESFRLSSRQPCVRVAEAAVRFFDGSPVRFLSTGGLDANWLTARGIPTVTLGCGQLFQHTCKEQLDLSWFHKACRIALWIATSGSG